MDPGGGLVPSSTDRNGRLPGLVVFHAWGGSMLFGKERIVNTGRDHPALESHRAQVYSGRYLADVAWAELWSPEALGQAAWNPAHGSVPRRSGLRYRMGNPTTPG